VLAIRVGIDEFSMCTNVLDTLTEWIIIILLSISTYKIYFRGSASTSACYIYDYLPGHQMCSYEIYTPCTRLPITLKLCLSFLKKEENWCRLLDQVKTHGIRFWLFVVVRCFDYALLSTTG